MGTVHGLIQALELRLKIVSKMQNMKQFSQKRLLNLILTELLSLCGCRSGSILLTDSIRQELVFSFVRGPRSRMLAGKRIPLDHGIVGWVATQGRPAWVSQPNTDNRFDPQISLDINVPAKSILCAPFFSNNKVIGVMEIIQSRCGVDFKPFHMDVLISFCSEAARVLQRAEELDQNLEKTHRLNALIKISQALNSERSISRLLSIIADSATKLMKTEAGSIVLKDEKSGELVFEATDKRHMQVLKMRLASGTGIIGKVINSGEKLIIEDFQQDPRAYKKIDKKTGFTTHSAVCVPIRIGNRIIGALEVLNRVVPQPFTMEDMRLFDSLADLSAIAIENARLYENLSQQINSLEQKNIELNDTRAKLVNSEKLAIIGEMAAGMSHEIRNLITPIQLIVEDTPQPDEIDAKRICEEYRIIKEQIDRATEMTSGLLTFSRKSRNDEVVISINEVVEKCLSVVRYRYKNSSIRLKISLGENIPLIRCIPSQIEQVLINLINNSENAIQGTGTIRITTRYIQDLVSITVVDNGRGITRENLSKVWEPFFSTKDEKTGTGLGLTICAGIISRHRGTITIASKENKGTTVRISLPPESIKKSL